MSNENHARNRNLQRDARALAASEGIGYQKALNRLTAQRPQSAAPDPSCPALKSLFDISAEEAQKIMLEVLNAMPHLPPPDRRRHRYFFAVDAELAHQRLAARFVEADVAADAFRTYVDTLGGSREVARRLAPPDAEIRSSVNAGPWRQSYRVYVIPGEFMVTDEWIAAKVAHACNTSPIETVAGVEVWVPERDALTKSIGWVSDEKAAELLDDWMARHGVARVGRRPAVIGFMAAPADARTDVYEVPASVLASYGHKPLRNAMSWG